MNTSEYQILIDRGFTTKQIAKEFNMSQPGVQYQLRKFNLHAQHWKPRVPITKEKLEESICRKLSQYDIAKELNCSQTTIRYWLNKHKLKTNCYSMCYV